MNQLFSINEHPFDTGNCIKLQNRSTGEYAQILPFLGGSVNELSLRTGQDLTSVIQGYRDMLEIRKFHDESFRSSQLFPFPNRLGDACYSLDNRTYRLPVNCVSEGLAIHGLIHDQPFSVIAIEEGHQGCSLTLQHRMTPTQGYPFSVELEVCYNLSESGLEVKTVIINADSDKIPVGYGWHPYFRLHSGLIDNCSLRLPACNHLEIDDRLLPTGRSFPFEHFQEISTIGDWSFDGCLQLASPGVDSTLFFVDRDHHGVRIDFSNEFSYLQIYTPPNRSSLALEPMTCAPDSFNNAMGLILLAPGKTLHAKWSVSPCQLPFTVSCEREPS